MDVKEFLDRKSTLDYILGKAVQPILNDFYKESGLTPSNIDFKISIDRGDRYFEGDPTVVVNVSTEFRLG